MSDFANYRRDLAVLDPGGSRAPQIQHNPPPSAGQGASQIAPWMSSSNGANHGATGGPGALGLQTTFYNDSSDNLSVASQLSPGFRPAGRPSISQPSGPGPGPDGLDGPYFNDERRPSIASITTTASSQGSKASGNRGGFRKLQGFFGEEFPGRDSSDTSLPHASSFPGKDRSHSYSRPHRDRNYSNATDHTRDASPSSSRPRTPVPAPEVVPFLYQEADVRHTFSLPQYTHSPSGTIHIYPFPLSYNHPAFTAAPSYFWLRSFRSNLPVPYAFVLCFAYPGHIYVHFPPRFLVVLRLGSRRHRRIYSDSRRTSQNTVKPLSGISSLGPIANAMWQAILLRPHQKPLRRLALGIQSCTFTVITDTTRAMKTRGRCAPP